MYVHPSSPAPATSGEADADAPKSEHAERQKVVVGWPACDGQSAHRHGYSQQRPKVQGTGTGMSAWSLWTENGCCARDYCNYSCEHVNGHGYEEPRFARGNWNAREANTLVHTDTTRLAPFPLRFCPPNTALTCERRLKTLRAVRMQGAPPRAARQVQRFVGQPHLRSELDEFSAAHHNQLSAVRQLDRTALVAARVGERLETSRAFKLNNDIADSTDRGSRNLPVRYKCH